MPALSRLQSPEACQPFTLSGDRKGKDDPRHLWPDVARIIGEVRPLWAFFENVPGHLSLGFADVVRDLQRLGYRVAACIVSAAEVGGPHLRERLFILAHADVSDGGQQGIDPDGTGEVSVCGGREPDGFAGEPALCGDGLGDDVGPAGSDRLDAWSPGLFPPMPGDLVLWGQTLDRWPDAEPMLHRLDHGLAHRLDRSSAAGNGVVPMAAARAWGWLRMTLQAAIQGI